MDYVKHIIQESIKAKESLYSQTSKLEKISNLISERFIQENKLLIFGNGGSAADAQHIAGELVGRFKKERKGLPSIALSTNTSILTAWSNDYDFSAVFERQVEALAKPNDVLFGISTSGNSKNVINAFNRGKEIGTYNFSLTGGNGGELKRISDFNINIYSNETPRIQEGHTLAYHIICELIECNLFS